jgi:hypothetical protein
MRDTDAVLEQLYPYIYLGKNNIPDPEMRKMIRNNKFIETQSRTIPGESKEEKKPIQVVNKEEIDPPSIKTTTRSSSSSSPSSGFSPRYRSRPSNNSSSNSSSDSGSDFFEIERGGPWDFEAMALRDNFLYPSDNKMDLNTRFELVYEHLRRLSLHNSSSSRSPANSDSSGLSSTPTSSLSSTPTPSSSSTPTPSLSRTPTSGLSSIETFGSSSNRALSEYYNRRVIDLVPADILFPYC